MIRPAATVMLVRPGGEFGFEVFMLRRSEASHFVPDVYVFPGGTLDEGDTNEKSLARARGIDAASLEAQFRAQSNGVLPAPLGTPGPRESAGLLIAGVRELFEEAGVLLACDAHGVAIPQARVDHQRERLHAARSQVQSGELAFSSLLEELDVYANCGALALFSQWITPPAFSRRYNAHFFVALAGGDQTAVADAYETHDGVWTAPRTALDRCASGEFRMVYPTIKHVERLAQFTSADEFLGFARTKTIYSIMPQTVGELQFSMPPELEFAW